VLIGKVCFAFAHLLFVAAGSLLLLWRIELPRALWVGMLTSGSFVAGGMLAFLFLQQRGNLGGVIRWLAARQIGGDTLQRAARDMSAVDDALRVYYRDRPRDLVLAICWHLLGYSLGFVQTWLFLRLLNQDASWATAATIWFLGMWFDLLTFAVPMNLGTLEGTRIMVFKAIGYLGLVGMTYGVVLRLTQLVWAILGLVSYGLLASPASEVFGRLKRRMRPTPGRLPALNSDE
jgi:hypothetical protein